MNIDVQKETILRILKEAGTAGSTKTKLKITSRKLKLAFEELIKNRNVENIGSRGRPCYVLKEFYNPLERAYGAIERLIINSQKSNELVPINKTKLHNSLPAGSVRRKFDEAVEFLINAKKLLKIKVGRGNYFLLVSLIRPYLPIERPVNNSTKEIEIDRTKVLLSYEKIREQKGFSNVEIYELQQDLEIPMEELKSFLLDESRRGRVVLSLGDWSLSSEETRSGAVMLDGKPHLLVRFL